MTVFLQSQANFHQAGQIFYSYIPVPQYFPPNLISMKYGQTMPKIYEIIDNL